MREDRWEWDRRYAEGVSGLEGPPVPLLVAWLPRLPRGRALDVAAGSGRNALCLARHGYRVDALDISVVALECLADQARAQEMCVRPAVVDLDDFVPPAATYDLILNTYYLNRKLLSQLPAALTPGGALVVETLLYDPAVDPPGKVRHRMRPGELAEMDAGLDVVHCADLPAEPPRRTRGVCQLVAFRPA